jgi:hypothetical protein
MLKLGASGSSSAARRMAAAPTHTSLIGELNSFKESLVLESTWNSSIISGIFIFPRFTNGLAFVNLLQYQLCKSISARLSRHCTDGGSSLRELRLDLVAFLRYFSSVLLGYR